MNQKAERLFSLVLSAALLVQFVCEVRVYDMELYGQSYFTILYVYFCFFLFHRALRGDVQLETQNACVVPSHTL